MKLRALICLFCIVFSTASKASDEERLSDFILQFFSDARNCQKDQQSYTACSMAHREMSHFFKSPTQNSKINEFENKDYIEFYYERLLELEKAQQQMVQDLQGLEEAPSSALFVKDFQESLPSLSVEEKLQVYNTFLKWSEGYGNLIEKNQFLTDALGPQGEKYGLGVNFLTIGERVFVQSISEGVHFYDRKNLDIQPMDELLNMTLDTGVSLFENDGAHDLAFATHLIDWNQYFREQGGGLYLNLRRKERVFSVFLQGEKIRSSNIEFKLPQNYPISSNFEYLKIYDFNSLKMGDRVKEVLRLASKEQKQGLVLDLRDNSGGSLSEMLDVLSVLLQSKKNQKVFIRKFNQGKTKALKVNSSEALFTKPIIIMMNGKTASSAELLIQGLVFNAPKDRKILLVGSPSFGKGSLLHLEKLSVGGKELATYQRLKTDSVLYDYKMPEVSVHEQGVLPHISIYGSYSATYLNRPSSFESLGSRRWIHEFYLKETQGLVPPQPSQRTEILKCWSAHLKSWSDEFKEGQLWDYQKFMALKLGSCLLAP